MCARGSNDLFAAVARVHARTFEHYRAWCSFVSLTPRCFEGGRVNGTEDSAIQEQLQDVADYLLLWSGCENLRRVSSYVCEMFHRRILKTGAAGAAAANASDQPLKGIA
jgi:hypothetical protein